MNRQKLARRTALAQVIITRHARPAYRVRDTQTERTWPAKTRDEARKARKTLIASSVIKTLASEVFIIERYTGYADQYARTS